MSGSFQSHKGNMNTHSQRHNNRNDIHIYIRIV